MKLINHYTKKESEYRFLTLDEIKALSTHALIIGKNNEVYKVTINGKVKTWKRDINRFEVPCKYGLYEYHTVISLTELVKEI